jgi:hypothetical protein
MDYNFFAAFNRMGFKPLINLRPTTMGVAFFTTALVTGIIAATSIEVRSYLDEHDATKSWTRPQKYVITILAASLIAFFIYSLSRFLFDFGEGLMATGPRYPAFL